MAGYDIYEKDGAVFRGKAGSFLVSEIQIGDEWIPYRGDRVAPALFGDHIGGPDDRGSDARDNKI
jgi:hypothetical protein